MKLILMGAPGSGKGTQAKKISNFYHLNHFSTGDLLRNNPDLTDEQKNLISTGNLIPDDMMLKIIKLKIESSKEGWILDGYPRTVQQAKDLSSLLKNENIIVLYFDIPENELISRITGRLTCPSCGFVFHKINNPPTKPGVCDNCQTLLEQRVDDNEKVIKKRLESYHAHTEPVIEYYQKMNILKTIEYRESQSIEKIFDNIKTVLRCSI